jgi:hypothetical protein
MFVKEITNRVNRGPLIMLIQLLINFGLLASLLFGLALPNFSRLDTEDGKLY